VDALIVVDIQNDFLPGGALAVPRSNEVLPIANRLIERASFVVATQDFHPAGHKSFASSHEGKSIGDQIELNGLSQILWPEHCVQGTSGAEFGPDLCCDQFDEIVQKGTHAEIDSYSGFFDNGHLACTGLEELLKSRAVKRCFVVGLATDYCVKFTVLDAIKCGFETVVVRDGCRGVNLSPNDEAAAFDEMKNAGATLILSSEVDLTS